MLKRIFLSYLGTLLIIICFLPVASKWTIGGHSLLYLIVFGSPIGVTIGLCFSDLRQRYFLTATIIRSIAGLLTAVLIVLALSLIRISPFWIKDGFMLIPACAPLLAAIMSGLILSKRVRSPKWNTLPTNGCTGSPINPAPGEPFRWTLIFKDFINYMKIKFLKTFSIMLQILGVIFLILIITPLIINFYFSFDKQLQDFSWKVIKVSDSKEILYQVNENVVTLVFEGRRQLKVLNGDCGIHNFTYKIGYENSFRTDSYHLVKGCPLWSLESNTYYDVMHVLDRVHKYRIDGDTLWLESYGHGEIVLMRNKSKL